VSETRRGLVALGDSITRGRGGTPALGVHFQSWAQWLAEALELPLTNLAGDGAEAADVLRGQVPRLRGPYDLAVLFVGVNDARGLDWDAARFEREVRAIVAALGAAADRVAVLTLPEDLGRPTAAPKPAQANAILRALDGVELVELADLRGRRHLLPDTVHPTSVGMVEIARRAAAALGAPLPETDVPPSGLRYEAWWWRLWLRDVMRRVRERRG
jgi:lysophospholipase L1-like esterase